MPHAQESRVLARPCERPFNEVVWQRHARRHAIRSRPDIIKRGGEIGEIAPRLHAIEIAATARHRRWPSRQCDVSRQQMVVFLMSPRCTRTRPEFQPERAAWGPLSQADSARHCTRRSRRTSREVTTRLPAPVSVWPSPKHQPLPPARSLVVRRNMKVSCPSLRVVSVSMIGPYRTNSLPEFILAA